MRSADFANPHRQSKSSLNGRTGERVECGQGEDVRLWDAEKDGAGRPR